MLPSFARRSERDTGVEPAPPLWKSGILPLYESRLRTYPHLIYFLLFWQNMMMREVFTEAIVLDSEPSGDFDFRVHLFTKELGRIAAKATSARKILSKLNAHLQPLNLIDVRLVQKNNFQIIDALRKSKLSPDFLRTARLIKELTVENDPDFSLWSVLSFLIQTKQTNLSLVLNALGYGMEFADCSVCGGQPQYFSLKQLGFYCKKCCFNIESSEDLLEVTN